MADPGPLRARLGELARARKARISASSQSATTPVASAKPWIQSAPVGIAASLCWFTTSAARCKSAVRGARPSCSSAASARAVTRATARMRSASALACSACEEGSDRTKTVRDRNDAVVATASTTSTITLCMAVPTSPSPCTGAAERS